MPKTLADMTAEERANCVGMWCEVAGQLEILAEPDGMVDYHDTAILHSVKRNSGEYVLAKSVTPRHDLPRAWTPDGEPELAQALAEESYFYGVQVWMGGRWIMMLTSDYGTSLMHRGKWFEHKHEAEECASTWSHDTPTRIVSQRRSPVEEIE